MDDPAPTVHDLRELVKPRKARGLLSPSAPPAPLSFRTEALLREGEQVLDLDARRRQASRCPIAANARSWVR